MKKHTSLEAGAVSGPIIASVVFAIAIIGLGSGLIWALINYADQKNNVDAKINTAVAQAKKEQQTQDQKDFLEREKEPYRKFVGPEDLGRVSFDYPKTWSMYIDKDDGQFEAYFDPITVHPLSSGKPHALRVSIQDVTYERSLGNYQAQVKRGDLKSTPITVNGFEGNRLDGKFSDKIQGSMVLFKIRDKTLRLYTESPTFKNDFDTIILKTVSLNP